MAICRTRQRNHYPKCLLCPRRDPESEEAVTADAKVPTSIFRTAGILGSVPREMNEYVMRKIGLASAQFVRSEVPAGSRVLVGCDLRENSRSLARVFCEGVNTGGMDTVNLGAVPPELLGFVLGTDGCAAAAFIGAGNLGENVNGVRLWRADGSPMGFADGLDTVGQISRRLRMGRSRLPGETTHASPAADYVAYLRKFARRLSVPKVALHAGHGAVGRFLGPLMADMPVELKRLGFRESSRDALLGERFPAEGVVASVGAAVRESKADVGAAVDFTGERIMFFDERGQMLRADVAGGLIAAELLARTPRATVTYDLRSTLALPERIAAEGGTAVAAPTGALAFAQHFRRTEAAYGVDFSGRHYFKSVFRFPSPFVALLMMCSYVSRQEARVSGLAAELSRFDHSGEIAIPTPSPDVASAVLGVVRDEFPKAQRELIDGVTVRQEGWWFNLRRRGNSAELRLTVEGRTSRQTRTGRQAVERIISRVLAAAEPQA